MTPFARPVIERALHAVVVALVRMLGGESLSQRPNSPLPGDELIERIAAIVARRVSDVDKPQVEAALERLNYVMKEWKNVPPSKYGDFSPPDLEEPLLYPSGSERHPVLEHQTPPNSKLDEECRRYVRRGCPCGFP